MKIREFLIAFGLFLGVTLLFFYPVFLRGHLPFPGDLLVNHYAPWNSYSFSGYAPGGVPHKAQGIDVVRMFFPWKNFSIEMIKRGEMPLWNPYNFSGNPHLANFQTGIFYPFNFVFFLFPFNFAWMIFIILQPLLAGCFTYLFLRKIKVSRWGAVIGSLAFGYSLYFTAWLEWGNIGHAILWLPLALFLIEKIIDKLTLKWVLLIIFSLASSILAGYIQTTIYLFIVVFAYFFFRIFSDKKQKDKFSKTVAVLAGGVLAPLLCLVQLLPTWEIFLQSAREVYSPEKISELLLPWFYPLTTFVPDFFGNPASRNYWLPGTYIERVIYIGILPLFFALLAIFYRRKEKIVTFFIGLVIIVLVLTLNLSPARFIYGMKIPILGTAVPTRILYLFAFSLAILAGFGVDYWLKQKKILLVPIILFGGVYFFLWLLTFLAPMIFSSGWIAHLGISQRNMFLPTAFFLTGALLLAASFWLPKKLLFLGILAVSIFDLLFYFHKITPFSPEKFVYPETAVIEFLKKEGGINRFWGYGTGYIESNFSTLTRTYSVDGYDPLFISRYGEFISTSADGKIKEPIPRADVILAAGYGQEALRENSYRQRLLNLLGVKYVLQKNEGLGEEWQPDYVTFPEEIYQLVWQEGPWQVYENKTALPRIFLVGDYQVEKNGQEIIDLIFDLEFELDKKIILEENLPPDFVLDNQSVGTLEMLSYQPNEIRIQTTADGNQLLFLSDNFYPGWQVYLDGEQGKIYRTNYSFRAVPVSKGKHEVVFVYQPELFKWGAAISGLTFAGVLFLGFLSYRKKHK